MVGIVTFPLENRAFGLKFTADACMGCTLCTRNYPEIFEMKNRKARVKPYEGALDMEKLADTIASCPVKAIEYIKNAHFS